jgi:hypothetical protein
MDTKPTQTKPVDVTKKGRFSNLKSSLLKKPSKKHMIILASICTVVLVAGISWVVFFAPKPAEPNPVPQIESTYVPPPTTKASPLTGVEVEPALAERPVTGVMVENSIDARPQSGLQEAGIVYEAIAEGGITRFLAVFQEAKPANIGPIRSARPYYVEWVRGYDARYVHSGGSGEALALIRALGVKDMDHGAYGERIASRVSSRYAPHNVYTSMDRIDALGNELGYTSSTFIPFARKSDSPPADATAVTAGNVSFNISSANYNTAYTYDPVANNYKRVMAGIPHTDQESGKQITPKVIVALITTYGIHPDRVHSVYGTTGTGEVIVFQDGIAVKGTWKKATQTDSLEILTLDGKPFELNRGQTWITAIPTGRTSYTP